MIFSRRNEISSCFLRITFLTNMADELSSFSCKLTPQRVDIIDREHFTLDARKRKYSFFAKGEKYHYIEDDNDVLSLFLGSEQGVTFSQSAILTPECLESIASH